MANEAIKERNIERVLKTAYDLFVDNGIDNTTKEMLVRSSGASRSSLDRYFSEKTDCVIETAKWAGENVKDRNLQIYMGFDKTQSGLDMLNTYMTIVRNLFYDKPNLFVFGFECRDYVYRNSIECGPDCDKLYYYLGTSELLKAIIEYGIEDKSIICENSAENESILIRESLIGFLTGMVFFHNRSADTVNSLVDMYISGVIGRYKNADIR